MAETRSQRYLTTEQAAAILGVAASEVRRLARGGLLPAVMFGRQWLILEEDARAYKRGQRGKRYS